MFDGSPFNPCNSLVRFLTKTTLLHFLNIFTLLEEKKVFSAIFLDVAQAFDKVWHEGLNYKLSSLVPTQYSEILELYISDRYFRVKQEEVSTVLRKIKAGVPKGSVLGPKRPIASLHILLHFFLFLASCFQFLT